MIHSSASFPRQPETANRSGVSDDVTPGEAANEKDFLVDLHLSGPVAEHPAEVLDLRGHEPVVLRQQADGGTLQVALRDGDELRRSLDLRFHIPRQRETLPK